MNDDVRKWLERLGLAKYAEVFIENDVDLSALPHITDQDLTELGVTVGARRKILAAIQSTQGPSEAQSIKSKMNDEDTRVGLSAETAERRQLTVMFCDLVGSTKLSLKLDPEDLRAVMRRYQDVVAGAVTRYGGHVAKYLGDGVLAYFGWPKAYEDQAERAIHAGLDAVAAIRSLAFDIDLRLDARVGVSTGQVVIGDLGGRSCSRQGGCSR